MDKTTATLDSAIQDLVDAAVATLSGLADMTSAQFALGEDRPLRVGLARALGNLGALTPEQATEYRVDYF